MAKSNPALCADRQPKKLRLIIMTDDREIPTEPHNLRPGDGESDSGMKAAAALEIPPNARVPQSLGPNPSHTDETMRDLLATAKQLKAHYETLLDPTGLLTKQTQHISTLIDTNYRLIHGEVIGIRGTLDLLAPRVTATEGGLAELRAEFVSMKSRMTQIEAALGLNADASDATGTAPQKTE